MGVFERFPLFTIFVVVVLVVFVVATVNARRAGSPPGVCPRCGAAARGANFCGRCGQRL